MLYMLHSGQPATPAVSLDEASEFLRLVGSSPDRAELFEAMLDRSADREAYEAVKAEALAKNQYPRHPRGALTRRRLYHAFEVVGPNLKDLNGGANPCGVFMTVAKFNGERTAYENGDVGAPLRTAPNVVRWDRVAADVDDKDLTPDQRRTRREELLPKLAADGASPSAVVITSDEKSHLWWALETPLDPAAGNELMKFIASALDTDPAASLMTQVLRVPGFLHWKAEPQAVRLDRANSSGFKHKAPDLIAAIKRITGCKSPKPRKARSGKAYPGSKLAAGGGRGLNADLTDGLNGATNVDELVDAIDFLVGHPAQPLGEHRYHEWRNALSACCVAIIEQEDAGAKILTRIDRWLTALGRVSSVHDNRFRGLMEGTQARLASGDPSVIRPPTVFGMALALGWRPQVPVEIVAAAAWRTAAQFMDGSEDDLGRAVQLLEFLKGSNPDAMPFAASLAVEALKKTRVAPDLVDLFASHYLSCALGAGART